MPDIEHVFHVVVTNAHASRHISKPTYMHENGSTNITRAKRVSEHHSSHDEPAAPGHPTPILHPLLFFLLTH